MSEKTQTPTVTKTYLHYLTTVIGEFSSIGKDYKQWRLAGKKNPANSTAESIAPIMAKIAIGLQRGSIFSINPSKHQANLEKVTKIIADIQAEIKQSMVPTLQIDPKTKKITTVFPPSTLKQSIFEDIKTLLRKKDKKFQLNPVVFNALYKKPANKKISEKLLTEIRSFLDFDEKQPLSLSSKELNENNTKIQVKGVILESFIERLPNRVLQGMLHNLRHQLGYAVSKPQEFLKQFEKFILKIKENMESIKLSKGITTLDLNNTIILWETKKLNLELMIEHNETNTPIKEYSSAIQQIQESLEDIAVKNTLEEKMHLHTQYNPEKFYPITLEAAQKIGMITQEQSTNIQKKIQEKQKICQLLQDATPKPEPFSWIEDFPEPELEL